jgi:hypothetical protein
MIDDTVVHRAVWGLLDAELSGYATLLNRNDGEPRSVLNGRTVRLQGVDLKRNTRHTTGDTATATVLITVAMSVSSNKADAAPLSTESLRARVARALGLKAVTLDGHQLELEDVDASPVGFDEQPLLGSDLVTVSGSVQRVSGSSLADV